MSEDIAWAAGLFEGEGCIYASGAKWRRMRRPALQVVSTDRDVIERFAAVVGAGTLGLQASQRGQKPLYAWRCQRFDDAVAVMLLLSPHLGVRRRARWRELLDDYMDQKDREAARAHATCVVCGVEFATKRPDFALYCSVACKMRAARRRWKETA